MINLYYKIVILILVCISSLPLKYSSLVFHYHSSVLHVTKHLNQHVNPDHRLQSLSLVMAEPGAPLSGEDLVTYIFKHINDALGSERKYMREVLKTESEHTTDKLSMFVTSYNQIFKNLSDSIDKLARDHSKILAKIYDLEHKMNTSVDILEDTIASVNLKVHTCSLYQENLLFKLKSALFETLSTIKTDKCCPCDNNDSKSKHNSQHLAAKHNVVLPELSVSSDMEMNIVSNQVDPGKEGSPELLPPTLSPERANGYPEFTHACTLCDQVFSSLSDLDIHVESVHVTGSSQFQNYTSLDCAKCGNTFEDFNDLCAHIQTIHTDLQIFLCEDCNIILYTKTALELHIEGDHITQIDGLELDTFDFDDTPNATVRSSNYTLNHEKQTMKIVKDASKNDYDISINNDDQNATIRCSSGFYLQVAKPCFTTIKTGSVFTKAAISITLDDVKITHDKNRTEASRLLHFSFMSNLLGCGGVTIHLHHSTRTNQIQGSHVMPTKDRSPVWFINTIVLPKFKDLAKAKQFAIKATNSTVLDINSRKEKTSTSPTTSLPTNPDQGDNTCNNCQQIFDTKSRPSKCNNCEKFFHKTRSLKEHTKACRPQSQQSSTVNRARTAITTLPTTTVTILPSITTAASIPAISTSTNVASTTSPPSTCPPTGPVISHPGALAGLQTLVSFIPASQNQNSGLPSANSVSQQPSTASALPSQPRTNKKKQKLPPITND